MNGMTYGGYTARIELDADDGVFVGRVLNVNDVIGFHGRSVEELEQAFREAIDNYLAACKELGQSPNKSYSGTIQVRVPPELHAAVERAAKLSGKSINAWLTQVIRDAAR